MEYTQDGITYIIKNGQLKSWKGTSPFDNPDWNGIEIFENWSQNNEDKLQAEKLKNDKRKNINDNNTVIWNGLSQNGTEYSVIINDAGKIDSIEI